MSIKRFVYDFLLYVISAYLITRYFVYGFIMNPSYPMRMFGIDYGSLCLGNAFVCGIGGAIMLPTKALFSEVGENNI